MILVYTSFNILCLIYSKRKYKNIYNPIGIYVIVWQIVLSLHQSGLIFFYKLTLFTWIIIFGMQIAYICGCVFGYKISSHHKNTGQYKNNVLRTALKKWIIITTIIAGMAILINTLYVTKVYGLDLLGNLTNIYSDRVNNKIDVESIPYLSSFIYITFSLCGIYLKKYGFSALIIPAFVLIFVNSLTSGGRAGIVFATIIMFSSYQLTDKICKKSSINETKKSKKNRILILIAAIALIGMIIVISNQRVAGQTTRYATEQFTNIFGNNVLVYKVLTYITGPIGALNEYLKTCEFNFGQNTFLMFYNLLARFGLIERIDQYQEFFNTPLSCNVATWIREVIEDFTVVGGLFTATILGCIVSFFYKRLKKWNNINDIIIVYIFFLVIILSFFDWRLRTSNTWIALVFGYLIGKKIQKSAV